MKINIKLSDIVIIILVTGITLFSGYSVYIKPNEKIQVLIRGQESEWLFPIEAEEVISVSGALGDTIVRIGKKSAWVERSPCGNKTCAAAGSLSRRGQWTACLPNNVFVMIQGGSLGEDSGGGDNVDAVAW